MDPQTHTSAKLLWKLEDIVVSDLKVVAEKIATELKSHTDCFCVALVGDLGAGKTTLVAAILKAIRFFADLYDLFRI
jgi:tRNA A37 threonylcarbamoyladenosine biosynthesis protein TsaE